MKSLFITHSTGMAGANRSMLQLMLELRDCYGVEPFVLLPPDNSKEKTLKHRLESEGIGYIETVIPYFKKPYCPREYRLDYVYYTRQLEELCHSKLAPMHFDLVHSNSSVIDFGGYISRILGVKHVWHLRDFGELDYNLHSIWGNTYDKATYRNGDVFIAISEAVKKHFEKVIPSSKIHTIYNGIRQKENAPLAAHQNECVQFFCAGAICEGKNQLEIVRAVDVLVNKRSETNFHLTIVGFGGGQYLKDLKGFVEQHQLASYVTFMDAVDGIESLASTMDVGIMSSKCEAFGRVTVEYMLQNLAVIANDSGANPEIIADGQTGLIYQLGSIESLAERMQRLISDRSLLTHLASSGRESALTRFLSSYNSREIFELYKHILKEPSSAPSSVKALSAYWIMQALHAKDVLMAQIDFKKRYTQKYYPPFKRKILPTDCITTYDEASDLISSYLNSDKPCMISRFGSVELSCMLKYRKGGSPLWFLRSINPFWVDSSTSYTMSNNAGFFSTGHKNYCKFADLLFDSARQVDVLGTWIENESEIENHMTYKKCRLITLNPFFAARPWSKWLEGKKVLVVHPFEETIKHQYEKRSKLFENPDVLPTFQSLTVIKSVQSIGGKCEDFASWFDALHHMEQQIDAVDYDIALIGCGAYGMPLAAHCKKMGKKAIHLGGVLQLMFGIRGKRWETEYGDEYRKMLSNPAWVRPLDSETPRAAKNVEGGCYW